MTDEMPTLRKIKRVASRHTIQNFCRTFNFAQPDPTQPPPQQRTMDNLTATFGINQNVNCNFDSFKLEK